MLQRVGSWGPWTITRVIYYLVMEQFVRNYYELVPTSSRGSCVVHAVLCTMHNRMMRKIFKGKLNI